MSACAPSPHAPLSQATSLPLTTFAQNNGVISLTAVASRQAGWSCAIWLFVLGVIAKFAAVITTIPDCVFGGMTTFLFANVIASGIKIIVGEQGGGAPACQPSAALHGSTTPVAMPSSRGRG